MKPFCWTWVLILLTGAAFVPDQVASFASVKTRKGSSSTISTATATATTTTLYQASHQQRHSANDDQGDDNDDDSEEHASPLHLSALDYQRLTRLQECRTEIPILIVGQALLPQQQLTFESSDPRFHRLYEYCLQTGSKLGILGLHPTTGRPLNQGVTVDLTSSPAIVINCYHHHHHHHHDSLVNRVRRLCVTGQERFAVQDEPWLDAESQSFFMAHVEMVQDRYEEPLTAQQQAHAETLAETLPVLMQEWSQLMSMRTVLHKNNNNNKSNKAGKKKAGSGQQQQQQRRIVEAMPQDLTQRALWVAAMLNPSDQQHDNNNNVCLDIRPAMLAASNDYDRTVLAVQAVQSSIDHLSGKHRLF